MAVKWFVTLSDGNSMEGLTDDGSWRSLPEQLQGRKIVRFHIFSETGRGDIDDNKDGYFLGNKMFAGLLQPTVELVGIGYYQHHDEMARIKWYNKTTMDLMTTEARHKDDCKVSLIINP